MFIAVVLLCHDIWSNPVNS